MAFELETMYEIWDNDGGEMIEVGPDRDGLNLVEVRLVDIHKTDQERFLARITMHPDQAEAVAKALMLAAANSRSALAG